jgi:hypothetical protein
VVWGLSLLSVDDAVVVEVEEELSEVLVVSVVEVSSFFSDADVEVATVVVVVAAGTETKGTVAVAAVAGLVLVDVAVMA